MNNSMKTGLIKVTLLSILIALSGMAAIASADEIPIVNIFYGNVTLNGADAPLETVINAYIDEELRGNHTITNGGKYYMDVAGNGSVDGGKVITFTVCGATAQTAVWLASTQSRLLDLTAVDDNVAPAVTDANANPTSIVADGVETAQLSVTVTDGCGVGPVTVDLSAIGGDAAQAMEHISDTDVYSVTVTAAEGTALGEYCLPVNASDGLGNCNTSVCIALTIDKDPTPEYDSADTNQDCVVSMPELIAQARKWKRGEIEMMELRNSAIRWKLGEGGYC